MSTFEAFAADIVFRTDTGKNEADIEGLRRVATQAYGQISDGALKLALAQDRLDRALTKYGPASRQAAQAQLAFRRELETTTVAANKQAVAVDRVDRETEQMARGVLAGSGAMHSLGRSVAFASAAYLGSAGLVYGIRESIKQAVEQSQVVENLRNALEAGGHSWDQYGAKIESATAKLKLQSAFDDEDLYKSLQLLLRGTGSVNRALTLNALAADVARGRHMGLVQSANLLIRAQAGQVGSLRRLGIEVNKGISGSKALAQVQQQYAGAAQAYADSAAGTQALFTIAIQDTEKAIGRGLLPTVVEVNKAIVPWLANTENQERIQEGVNQVVTDGAKIAKGFADAISDVAPAVEGVVGALGGLDKAVETALIVGLLLKARKAALGFGIIQAASARTRVAVVADAAAETAALDGVAAAESRVAAGFGTKAGAVAGGVLSRGGGVLRTAGETAALFAAVDIIANARNGSDRPDQGFASWSGKGGYSKFANDIAGLVGLDWLGGPGKKSSIDVPALYAAITRGEVTPEGVQQLKGSLSDSDYQALLNHAQEVGTQNPVGIVGSGTAGKKGALPFTPQQQRAINLQNAAADPLGTQAKAAYESQAAYDRSALAFLDQRRRQGKISNADYLKKYQAIEGDLTDMQGRIQSIADKAASDAESASSRAKTARDKQQRARDKLVADTAGTVRARLLGGQLGGDGLGLSAKDLSAYDDVRSALLSGNIGKGVGVSPQQIREMNAAQLKKDRDLRQQLLQNRLAEARLAETQAGTSAAKIAKAKKGELAAYQAMLRDEQASAKGLTGLAKAQNIADQIATRQAIAQLQNDMRTNAGAAASARGQNEAQFLSSFHDIVSNYAPNAFPAGGAQSPQLHSLVNETRQTNRHLSTIVAGGRYPASKYQQLERDAVYG